MKSFGIAVVASLVAASLGLATEAHSAQDNPKSTSGAANLSGLHDFDFLVGDWHVEHRRLKERLAGSHEWEGFDGTCSMRKLMDGWSNVDDNVVNLPGRSYRAVGLRSYDPQTAQWAIWWLDGRTPHGALDPPVKGGFKNGVGTFYANDTLRGKPVRVRFTWSNITATGANWEQAFSPDDGKTWEVNWTMVFKRISKS